MGRLRDYWRNLSKEGRELYAGKIGITSFHMEIKYICKQATRRQTPRRERMEKMIEGSNGEVTAEGLAFDFVIEPLTEKQAG